MKNKDLALREEKHHVDYSALEKIHNEVGGHILLDPRGNGQVALTPEDMKKLNNYRKISRRTIISAHSATAFGISTGGVFAAASLAETALLFPALLVSMVGPVFNIVKAVAVHDRFLQDKKDFLVYGWNPAIKEELFKRQVQVKDADVPTIALGFAYWALGDRNAASFYINKIYDTSDGKTFSLKFNYDNTWEVLFHQRQSTFRHQGMAAGTIKKLDNPLLGSVMKKIFTLQSQNMTSEDRYSVDSINKDAQEAEQLALLLKDLQDPEYVQRCEQVLQSLNSELDKIIAKQQTSIKNQLTVLSRNMKIAVGNHYENQSFSQLKDPGIRELR